MIAWSAVVLGINSTRNAGNFTRLRLVKITSCIARAINPADHAIIYTYTHPIYCSYISFSTLIASQSYMNTLTFPIHATWDEGSHKWEMVATSTLQCATVTPITTPNSRRLINKMSLKSCLVKGGAHILEVCIWEVAVYIN